MPFRASSSVDYACRPVWVGVARRWTLGEWEGGLRDRRGTWRSSGISLSALSSPISHVIRWSDKLTTGRKPQNFNDVNSKFEGVARELRAKFEWGTGIPGVSRLRQSYCDQEFRVVELCAMCATLLE